MAGFASCTGLQETKMNFPFSRFEDESFLRQTSLPPLAKDWFDTLRQEAPSQDSVDKALADFARLGCRTVGDFLEHYLRMDVKLLGKACVRYLGRLHDLLKLHPIDASKYSASSYAAETVQLYLYSIKSVACYSPYQKQLFHWIKTR